jgi:hypothetical protein
MWSQHNWSSCHTTSCWPQWGSQVGLLLLFFVLSVLVLVLVLVLMLVLMLVLVLVLVFAAAHIRPWHTDPVAGREFDSTTVCTKET